MDSRAEKLQHTFYNMVYGENLENTKQATEWLHCNKIVDKTSDIDSILKNIKVNPYIIETSHLNKLAQEVSQQSQLITHIEILARGILSKDTKKAVNILTQYFYYYANFVNRKEPNQKRGFIAAVFEDDHPLWLLGLVLAPAFAAGYRILLQAGTKFSIVINFLEELVKKVGIPEDVLIVVPSNEGNLHPYLENEHISIVTLFVDLLDPKYTANNLYNKKLLILSSYRTPMIVFDNTDFDSAVENVIDAAWGYQGMLPWTLDTIIIQENIFNKFVEKLKNRISSIKIGHGNDKNVDISYPNNSSICQKLIKAVEKAKSLGIDVYQKDLGDTTNFTPTLIIGSKIHTNNVLTVPEKDGTVTLLPFRSIDEAVNLANNSRQGLGASVWCENIGLINEVARKLKVNNVWINSHGLFSPEIPLLPFKDSGFGYFGSDQGFAEYNSNFVIQQKPSIALTNSNKIDANKNLVSSAKSAYLSWSRKSCLDKFKVLQELNEFIRSNKSKFLPILSEKWINNFLEDLETVISKIKQYGSFTINGYNVTLLKEPRGVLIIEMQKHIEQHNVKLLLAALLEGNAVLLLNQALETEIFYQEISKKFPPGTLSALPYSIDAVKMASLHKELGGYFSSDNNSIFGEIPLADSKMFRIVNDNWPDAFNNVVLLKNIWSNIGQSTQCNY